MAGVRVVLFDLDDTLFQHAESVAAGLAAHRASYGGEIADADAAAELARWMQLEELHYHRYLAGEIDFIDQRRARMRDFVAPYGITFDDDEAVDWYERYLVEYQRAWAIHDDAIACLDGLAGARFGIITNGELSFQLPKLEAIGLMPRMEHVVASGQFGVAKPDPRIFVHACELFGVTPSEAAYVGDRFATDAIGAAQAGLTGVWVDRRGIAGVVERRQAEASAVEIVTSLSEIPHILAR